MLLLPALWRTDTQKYNQTTASTLVMHCSVILLLLCVCVSALNSLLQFPGLQCWFCVLVEKKRCVGYELRVFFVLRQYFFCFLPENWISIDNLHLLDDPCVHLLLAFRSVSGNGAHSVVPDTCMHRSDLSRNVPECSIAFASIPAPG